MGTLITAYAAPRRVVDGAPSRPPAARPTPQGTFEYQPALDGVRALAVLGVMWFHVSNALPRPFRYYGGFQSVDVFFAISGYLITSLFLAEYTRSNGFNLRAFYGRRAVRLLPALALAFGIAFAVSVAEGVDPGAWLMKHTFVVFGFVANWFAPRNGLGILEHTWSLAIEEQFYLVWPIILLCLLRTKVASRSIVRALIALATVVFVVRLVLITLGDRFIVL